MAYTAGGEPFVPASGACELSAGASSTAEAIQAIIRVPVSFFGAAKTLRFRWESADGSKIVDVVSTVH
jgi:hypothetical protein